MSDIFLSYAHEDLERARQLAQALARQGWDVFWDRTIPAGKNWRSYLEEKLEQSKCVVVAWSKVSVMSNWVIEEADSGLERNTLVPVLLETVRLPLGFRQVHAEDLSAWDGTQEFPSFQKLLRDIEGVIGPMRSKKKAATEDVPQKQAAKPSSQAPENQQRQTKEPGTVFRDKLSDGSQGPEMVIVPAGNFKMGDIQGKDGDAEKPVHSVSIPKPFAMGRYQITFEEYDRFASATSRPLPNDRGWGRGRQPVINVSWEDAVEYSKWLSEQTGKLYRLATEAEWEYAARSGGRDETWAGTSHEQELGYYAWYDATSGGKTQPVGAKKPNGIGLYDMSGNVWEWVEDCWHENYNGAPTDGSAWLQNGDYDRHRRVIRGGSWRSVPADLRSSFRGIGLARTRDIGFGFRLARNID